MKPITKNEILIKGARENNLKNITVSFPRNKLSVVTGISGSGKSSLVFDILCQEGERKFIKASGKVADHLKRPNHDEIVGLSPIVSVAQTNMNRSPRSTVGTFSEIYTYLRLLFAALGVRKCTTCGHIIELANARSLPLNLDEEGSLEHAVLRCPGCQSPFPNYTMAHFSFNTPHGACEACSGIGERATPMIDKVIDKSRSIREGGMLIWRKGFWRHFGPILLRAAQLFHIPFSEEDLDRPIGELPAEMVELLLYGTDHIAARMKIPAPGNMKEGRFEGIIPSLLRRYYGDTDDEGFRDELRPFFQMKVCEECNGTRLKKSSLEVKVFERSIADLSRISLEAFLSWVQRFEKEDEKSQHARPIIDELKERTSILIDMGLSYLTLDRKFTTLSGGEIQRMRLASLLHSGLVGMICVLDEPTSGLHPADTLKLVQSLKRLRDQGNTVIVVEHDIDVMKEADYIVDIGPFAGTHGGHLVIQGTVNDVIHSPNSITGKYLRKNNRYQIEQKTRPPNWNAGVLEIVNASNRNLKNINARLPLQSFNCIVGVSGSGKSTLVFEYLVPLLSEQIKDKNYPIDKMVLVDQDAMGRMSRSNAATYTGAFDALRNVFAQQAKIQGFPYRNKDFSFNVPGGRCETCSGNGFIKMQMQFMPHAEMVCSSCKGKRYRDDILKVRYNGATIHDVLEMTIKEAAQLFEEVPAIRKKLDCLVSIGLGYLKLGQPSNTLSGGEAQRVKLATELASGKNTHTLYIMDEPSIGLHPDDVSNLCNVMKQLVQKGNTLLVIEHNLDIIRQADYILELGPEGGERGGYVIASGSPEEIKKNENSITGKFL